MVKRSFSRLGSLLLLLSAIAPLSFAQQTGSISGSVTAVDGSALPGVTVEATSNVLPSARVALTDETGFYRLPALVPGTYRLQFSLAGMQTATRNATALLGQNTAVNITLGVAGMEESITVTAEASLVDTASTELKSGLSSEEIQSLPVGQQYRDLIKLIPGVAVTQDEIRGPSSGASGQDNEYQFDGVNVSLPQYGTLAAEPSSHDIAQVSVIKGGAKALDFNRAGGFTVDSVSKSGTNKFSGMVSYQLLSDSMTAEPRDTFNLQYDEDRTWTAANIGGPILSDKLFFYGSYYRPTRARENRANLYGDLPEYESNRNEAFGKLTFTPWQSVLFNVSYRTSNRRDTSILFGPVAAASTGEGSQVKQKIGILEASWIVSSRSLFTAKINDFEYLTSSRPDNTADVEISTALGTKLDINNLANMGLLNVPLANTTNAAANAFRQQYIDRYGYIENGTRKGGGTVGFATTFDRDDFFRESWQIGYDHTLDLNLGTKMSHDLHVGYQRFTDAEELERGTNGWGSISVIGGSTNCPANRVCAGQPIFFQAAFQQQSTGVPPIYSEIKAENIELNDTIRWNNWSFNAGVMLSHDTLYGQGLKEADNLAGYVAQVGSRYEMYDIPFEKMIQPRLGATWAYNGSDTVYGSFSIYNPATNSLPRAASWDRNLRATILAYFDQNGVLIGTDPVAGSSGKLFMPDMKPRTFREYMIGSAQQFNNRWSARVYGRYRKGDHYWEDTNNTARIDCGATAANLARAPELCNPPNDVPRTPYIPDLDDRRRAIGNGSLSGSTYVIANLDNAFTKFYEATFETDWRNDRTFIKGTYTWSHYYGNFDQDGTTGCSSPPSAAGPCEDFNTFIGSSNYADAPGRQVWDRKYGDLHGDRRHMLKVYGSYSLPWNASAGAFAVYQSGQPWEAWDRNVYAPLIGTSTSDTIRYAEPAGSRRTPSHYQVDFNYIQQVPIPGPLDIEVQADVFNLTNRQTARRFQPSVNSALFGQPVQYYAPRRYQLALRLRY